MATPKILKRTGVIYRSYPDKYAALIRQGFTESEAARMAHNIPQIYG